MSCNCNKCHQNNDCGCLGGGLTNPCSYTECTSNTERCEEAVCSECVTWCGPTTEVQDPAGNYTFVVYEGERLESIIQRTMLVLAQGLGTCTSSNLFHAPWNIYFGAVTANSIEILWAGEDANSTGIEILMDSATTPTGYVSQGIVTAGVYSFTILNLTPATGFKFKLSATDGSSTCESVVVYKSTI